MKNIDAILKAHKLYADGKIKEAKSIYISFVERLLGAFYEKKEIVFESVDLLDCINNLKESYSSFPEQAYILFEESSSLMSKHSPHKAVILLTIASKLKQDFAEAYYNCANLCLDLGYFNQSVILFNKFIDLVPNFQEAYLNKGAALQNLGNHKEAVNVYNKVININPKYAEAFNNRGNAYYDLGKFQEALDSFDQAIKNKINYAEALSNKGTVLRAMEYLDESLRNFNWAIKINPNYGEAISNRASLSEQKKLYINAMEDYDKAIDLQPSNQIFKLNKGMLCLKLGRFKMGLELYESRTNIFAHKVRKSKIKKLLKGDSINGKRIFVYSEQGLGDTLQFFRFINILTSLDAKVFFETQSELKELLKNSNNNIKFVGYDNSEHNYDFYCSLLSLPYLFDLKVETDFFSAPYISSEINKVKFWTSKLGPRSKYRVGLVWSGGFRKNQPRLWATNKRRNIDLQRFKAFSGFDFVEFYSLQKGKEAEAELEEAIKENWGGPIIFDYTAELNDFSDTAGLIENLDLIISVDTSTAHLAAAIGKPVWLLNRYDTCWRWLDDGRVDSPWYPSIRIFRQPKPNDWGSVIEDICAELKKLTSCNS